MKQRILGISLAFAAVAACASGARAEKLYLYAEYGQYTQGGVLRFPIVNGKPSEKSDFQYSCKEIQCGGLQLAVAPDGTLYFSNGAVYAFKPRQHAPRQRLLVPYPSSCYGSPGAYGVAVNADGFLAVGGVAFNSGAELLSPDTTLAGCEMVYLYAPHAHGQPSPVEAFALGSDTKFLIWVPSGNLYVIAGGYGVIEYAQPLSNPQVVAQYQTGYNCYGNGGAVDEHGTLYVFAFCSHHDEIEVFRPSSTYPVRRVILPFRNASYLSNVNLAISNGFIYVANQTAGTIELFNQNGNGPQRPAYKIQLPEPGGGPLAIGP